VLRSAHIIQLCVVALLGVGLIMTASAGMEVGSPAGFGTPGSGGGRMAMLNPRALIYAGLALAVMFAASRINVRQLFATRAWANASSRCSSTSVSR